MESPSDAAGESNPRTVRPILRALGDLGLSVPDIAHSLSEVDHPALTKARALAATFPDNTIRIQSIRDAMVYRFTHGRLRMVAWLDKAESIIWLCAISLRGHDTYDEFIAMHDAVNCCQLTMTTVAGRTSADWFSRGR